jgi:hypothetical protein
VRTAKVLLLFPPQFVLFSPYLSVPSLTAYLRAHGCEVHQRDLNAEVNRIFLGRPFLERMAARVTGNLTEMERESKAARERGEEGRREALRTAAEAAPLVLREIDGALRGIRDPVAFYDLQRLQENFRILSRAYDLISAAHFPTEVGYDFRMRFSPLSTADIHEAIAHETENPFVSIYREAILPEILEEGYDLIGLSVCYESQIIPAFTLARLLKEEAPEVHITMGGAMVTKIAGRLMESGQFFDFVDSGVLYEGENPLLELVGALEHREGLARVRNLLYRKKGGIAAHTPFAIEDVSRLPTPTFDGFPLEDYLAPEPILPLLASRGCYWNRCAFCTHSHSYQFRYRPRPKARLVEDLDALSRRYGARFFFFPDESVSLRQLEIIAAYGSARNRAIRWFCDVRFEDGLTAEFLGRLHEGGCRFLIFGLESACQRVLDLMEKGIRVEAAERILSDCKHAGIATAVLFFTGFPTETKAEAYRTFEFIQRNRDCIDQYGNCAFSLQGGSKVFRDPRRYEVTEITRNPDEDLSETYEYSVQRGLSAAAARQIAEAISRRRQADPKYGLNLSREITLLYETRRETCPPA